MFFNRKVITSISSTLFVASYAKTAPLVEKEVRTRELDSTSCSCEITDLYGSEFSCTVTNNEYTTVFFTTTNFGEEGSEMDAYNDGSFTATLPFDSSSASSANYIQNGDGFDVLHLFLLDPTDEIAVTEGVCPQGDVEGIGTPLVQIPISFGCWACPPTPPPTVVPTSSPSNEPSLGNNDDNMDQTDDAGDDENENAGECCCCSEKTKDLRFLIASLL